MTTEAQRMAIVKWMGWKFARIEYASCGGAVFEDVWFKPGVKPCNQTADWISENGRVNPPDCFDLNYKHEVEEFLTNYQHKVFRRHLWMCIESERDALDSGDNDERHFVSASAELRIEAILKTLDLWTE